MTKVAIIYSQYFDRSGNQRTIGGVETYLDYLAKLLDKMGMKVRLFQSADKFFEKDVPGMTVEGVPQRGINNQGLYNQAIEYLQRNYEVSHQPEVERIPQEDRARWRWIVTTPDGVFLSTDEAGEFYDVHSTTINTWCGEYNNGAQKREGFSSEKKFCSLTEAKKWQ